MIRLLLKATLLIVAIDMAAGCKHFHETNNDSTDSINWLQTSDPEGEARQAINRQDFRFLAVRGYTLEVPGVRDYHDRFAKYGYRLILGTSDAVSTRRQGRRQQLAVNYAASYNQILREYLLAND